MLKIECYVIDILEKLDCITGYIVFHLDFHMCYILLVVCHTN